MNKPITEEEVILENLESHVDSVINEMLQILDDADLWTAYLEFQKKLHKTIKVKYPRTEFENF